MTELEKYEQNRHLIKSGDLLLCSGNTLFSRMIQRFTGSKWSHVAFIIRIPSIDRIMVLESVESIGVRAVSLSSYINNYNGSGKRYDGELMIARHKEMKDHFIEKLSKKAVDLLGHPYDGKEVARIAARISLGKFVDLTCTIPEGDSDYICSEYVNECYKSIGINITPSCGFVSPADFANCKDVYSVLSI